MKHTSSKKLILCCTSHIGRIYIGTSLLITGYLFFLQVLEAHGLEPIKLEAKEVCWGLFQVTYC